MRPPVWRCKNWRGSKKRASERLDTCALNAPRPEGNKEGRVVVLGKLLTVRFGKLPEGLEGQLRSADGAVLEGIAGRILYARTLEDALG